MKAFFSVICIVLAIIFVCTAIFAGFKALVFRSIDKLKEHIARMKQEYGLPKQGVPFSKKRPDELMHVITLTTGQCQGCGRIYVGTTEDEDCPLKEVEFMGESKVLCDDCLTKLMAEFRQSGNSKERRFSQSARRLRDILSGFGEETK